MFAKSSFDTLYLTGQAEIAEAIVHMQQAGEGYRLPLIRAAAEGRLAALAASHGAPVPTRYLTIQKPTVISLCDDHPGATGPGRWKQVRRLLRWANVTVLHATGGEEHHYELITAMAMMLGRVLVIEMQQQHHAAWKAMVDSYAPRLKGISIVPPAGDCHPRLTAPAGAVVH
jgi:uncharacterized protein YndB with AHSA1/START domain